MHMRRPRFSESRPFSSSMPRALLLPGTLAVACAAACAAAWASRPAQTSATALATATDTALAASENVALLDWAMEVAVPAHKRQNARWKAAGMLDITCCSKRWVHGGAHLPSWPQCKAGALHPQTAKSTQLTLGALADSIGHRLGIATLEGIRVDLCLGAREGD